MSITVQDLVEGLRNGNKASQQTLYDRYSGRFFALCYRYSKNKEQAEDLLIDGFLTIFESIDKYHYDGSFENWMTKIFVNRAISQYYREQKHTIININEIADYEYAHEENTETAIDIKDAFQQSLQTLSSDERLLFNMITFEGYSCEEVMGMLRMNISKIKRIYYKAKDKMQQEMYKYIGHAL